MKKSLQKIKCGVKEGMTTNKKDVEIVDIEGSWLVAFVNPKRHSNKLAAQFSKDMKTRDEVAKWVVDSNKHKLTN